MSDTALRLSEGIELGYALVARIAEDIDARALAIKGQVNEAHSLRTPRESVDVDVLVEPDRFDDLVAGVGATAATQWLCDKVPKSPEQLAVRAGCVAVLGLAFGRIIRTFQVAADKGQCVRLRFIIPPAAVNGSWRITC